MKVLLLLLICFIFVLEISAYYPFSHHQLKKCQNPAYNACEKWCYREYFYGRIALTCCNFYEKEGECPRGCLLKNGQWDLRDLYCNEDKSCPHGYKCCSDDCYEFHKICKPIFKKLDCVPDYTTPAGTTISLLTTTGLKQTTTGVVESEASPGETTIIIKEESTTPIPQDETTTILINPTLNTVPDDKEEDDDFSGSGDYDMKEGKDKEPVVNDGKTKETSSEDNDIVFEDNNYIDEPKIS